MEFLRHPLTLQRHPRKRKFSVSHLKLKGEQIVYLLNQRMMHYLIIGQKPTFVLSPIQAMIKSEVDILSLQQLEYEMDCADLPDD